VNKLALQRRVFSFLFLAASLLASCRDELEHQRDVTFPAIVIEGGTLIDGTGAPPTPDNTVIIEGDRIKSISQKGSVTYPKNARVINAQGKFILPGLIDLHTHTRNWTGPLFLMHGITSVIDTANMPEWIFAQAAGIAKGRIIGPRLFPVGEALGPSGEGPGIPDPRFAMENAEQVRKVAQEMVTMGAVAFKVNHLITVDMLQAVVEVAQQAGIPVTGHLGQIDARQAALNGINGLQHATGVAFATIKDPGKLKQLKERYPVPGYSPVEYYMEPENYDALIALFIDRDVTLIPTLNHYIGKKASERRDIYYQEDKIFLQKLNPKYFPMGAVEITYTPEPYSFQRLPADDVTNYMKKLQVGWNKLCDFVGRFKRAGGEVLAGSDDGAIGIPGKGLHREMELLVSCGLTPMEAIMAATKNAAEFMHQEGRLGTIETGKLADMVLLEKNPLEDIRNIQTISLVIKDGKVIDPTSIDLNYKNPLPVPIVARASVLPTIDFIPRIQSIDPYAASEDAASFNLIIHGSNFFDSSIARFDTVDLRTKFVSTTSLEAEVPVELLKTPGTYAVTVTNPGSGGGPSNIAYFMVKFR